MEEFGQKEKMKKEDPGKGRDNREWEGSSGMQGPGGRTKGKAYGVITAYVCN